MAPRRIREDICDRLTADPDVDPSDVTIEVHVAIANETRERGASAS